MQFCEALYSCKRCGTTPGVSSARYQYPPQESQIRRSNVITCLGHLYPCRVVKTGHSYIAIGGPSHLILCARRLGETLVYIAQSGKIALVNNEAEMLYQQLSSPDPHRRDSATARLWQLYFGAAGSEAEIRLLQAEQAIESGVYDTAEEWLNDLITDFPDFAEAWNRRATLYYLVKNYSASLADCEVTIRLEPNHFGAWHGMGLNYMAMRRYDSAARAFKRALAIQPFSESNQKLFADCLVKLN